VNDDFLETARRLRERAGGLQSLAAELRGLDVPRPVTGVDDSGAVAVTVDADGGPQSIVVQRGWHRWLTPEQLAPAVLDAYGRATAGAADALLSALDGEPLREALTDADRRAAPAGERPPTGGAVRDPTMLTEEILQAVAANRTGDVRPAGHVGRSAERAVVVTVGAAGLLDCEVDARWAADREAGELNAAFAQALREAGQEVAAARSRDAAEAGHLDDLARQALATLAALGEPQPGTMGGLRR